MKKINPLLALIPLILFLNISSSRLSAQQNTDPSYTVSDEQYKKDLKEQLKKEILAELKGELKAQLREEIKQELLDEMGPEIKALVLKEIEITIANRSLLGPSTEMYFEQLGPEKQEAIRRIIKDVLAKEYHLIPDSELDAVVASGSEAPIMIGPGFQKRPKAYELAKTQERKKQTSDDAVPRKAYWSELDVTAGQKRRAESIERTLVQKGGLLLPKNKWQVEPSVTWAHFSSSRIHIQGFSILPVLVIGDISTQKVKRDIMIYNLALKYGLGNHYQAEVKIPLRWEHVRETDTSFLTESTRDKWGFGDVEFGLSKQIAWEKGLIPDLVASVFVKTRSGESYNESVSFGTGHWAVRGSLIAAKSSDPVVIFGGLTYTYNFERDNIPNFGTIKPGNTIGYSLGAAIALSYQTAINFSFDHSLTQKTQQNSRQLKGTFLNVANFKTGLNWAINENFAVDLSVTVGMTDDAPDATVSLRFPYTF